MAPSTEPKQCPPPQCISDRPIVERIKNGYHPMTEGVRWSEKYADTFERIWSKLPRFVATTLGTLAVFLLGTSMQGDWIIIAVHALKQFGFIDERNKTAHLTDGESGAPPFGFIDLSKFQHFWYFFFWSAVGSYVIFFGIGGFLHWYFYVRQRDRAHDWKCQPEKFLSPELERHEVLFGSSSLLCVCFISGLIASYSFNGGTYQQVYYSPSEYGWLWFFLQVPVIFIYQDYATYWTHRMYHIPFLYKNFHKMHHKYKQPTAFSVTAIHPVEIIHMQLVLAVPVFVIPVHWVMFYAVGIYTYYHAILDHSGITFKAQWWQPWQPDAIFHDNHHQYTHVNFGFNIELWDRLHGTYRRKDRVYDEHIFYGKGLALDEVSEEVLQRDIAQRQSENPLAYKSNTNENALDAIPSKRIVAKVSTTSRKTQ